MKATVVLLPDNRVLVSVPAQEGVSFEEAQAAIRKLRAKLSLDGFVLAGEDVVETHLPTAEHEAIHQAERQAQQ